MSARTFEMSDDELLNWIRATSAETLVSIMRDRDQILRERNAYREALATIANADEWSGGVWFRGVAKAALK